MKTASAIFLLAAICFGSCNPVPPPDYAGLYYPVGKPPEVDSSEVLRVAHLEKEMYVFKVSGNNGVGKTEGGVVSGELTGFKFGKAPFTFRKREDGHYEFRAFGSVVELVRLPGQP